MKLQFTWQDPVLLAKNKKIICTDKEVSQIEDIPGVYYFARHFGRKSEPFYIGETLTLRSRLKNHLASKKIADILRGMYVADAPAISNGHRWFHFAYLDAKKNKKNTKKALQITQGFMIREAIAANVPLLNSKLTVIKTHRLTFGGKNAKNTFFGKENSVAQ